MPSRGGLPYYITAECGRLNCPSLWFMAILPCKILLIFDNGLLSQMTSELLWIKCIFMKIMQKHHNTIKCKVKGISEKNVDNVYVMIYL